MKISGIGILFSRGLGIAALETALTEGWRRPDEVELPWQKNGKMPAYRVKLDAVQDRTLLKKIRRADKLSKMSVLAAADAIADSGIADIQRRRLGVILATAFGAHVTTFSFLDDILNFGDAAVSPTTFSNSVHNAAASYVSSSLGIQGPTLTITQFQFSFESALQLAQTWLGQDRCDHVLLGAVDEYGDVLAYVSNTKLITAKDGKIRPFVFNPTCHVPGEGAVFFVLSKANEGKTYCTVDALQRYKEGLPDLDIIHANGMMPDETVYRSCLSPDVPVAAYAPIFGSMMISSAFHAATGALMVKRQKLYANPVQDKQQDIRLVTETREASINAIRCTGYDCFGQKNEFLLKKG